MKLTWKLDDSIASGTSLRGNITTTFTELVKVFGQPNVGPTDKTWNEWNIEFRTPIEDLGEDDIDDYDIVDATIYDWKESSQDASRSGLYRWHIGGKDYQSVELVYEALGRFEPPLSESSPTVAAEK